MAINVPIISEFQDKGLKKAMKDFKRLETSGQKAAFALKKAFVPATAALGGLAVVGSKMVLAGERAATANSRIQAVTTSMNLFGAESKKVADNLIKVANAQALATGEDQNAIKLGMAKLLTFSEIAKTADEMNGIFARTTQVSLDLAAAGFGTVKDNATQLGKALQDPIKGLSALTRSGVTFTRAEQDKIRTLVESNRLHEAQDMILKAIEQQVGGTAAATRNATDRIKVSFSLLTEQIGLALLPVLDALLPKIIGIIEFMMDHKNVVIGVAAAIGGLSAAIVVANIGMKIYTATTAIATAAQWAFNTAVGAIALPIVAVVAFTAALVALERASEKASRTFRILLPGINGISDAITWLKGQTEDVNEEWAAFNQTIDESRRAAGNMYPEIDRTASSVDDLMTEAVEATKAQLELAESVNAVYSEVRKLNPELVEMLGLLDVQDDIEGLKREFDDYNETIADAAGNVRVINQAQRDLTRAIIETLSAHGLLTLAFDKQLKIKIDTGDLDAAYASALRVLNAFQQVQQVSAGQRPSTYIPPRDELGFLSAPPVATTTITPVASITRAPSGAVQNVTVNVNTPTPTEEIGKVVVDSIRKYNRTSGSASIGVLRL